MTITLPAFYETVNAIEDPSAWETFAEKMLNTPFSDVHRIAAEMDLKRQDAPKEYGAIMGSIYENISFASDPKVREALSASDFSLDVPCKEECMVSIIIPAELLGVLAPMQRAIFGSAMIYKFRHPSAPRVLFLVDEAGQLGAFDALRLGYSYARGQGVRMWTIWQAPGQIIRNFGSSSLSEFIGSAQVRQFFGIRDIETARTVSAMLGTQTLRYDDALAQQAARRNLEESVQCLMAGGDPLQAAMAAAQFAYAETHQTEQGRALLDPAELLTLPEHEQILYVSGLGLDPILAERFPYWTQAEMAGAFLPNPYHPPLDRVRIKTRWRSKTARIITERVPPQLAHLPQYQSGEWSYVEGYRPAI